jgi:hypothetical protein
MDAIADRIRAASGAAGGGAVAPPDLKRPRNTGVAPTPMIPQQQQPQQQQPDAPRGDRATAGAALCEVGVEFRLLVAGRRSGVILGERGMVGGSRGGAAADPQPRVHCANSCGGLAAAGVMRPFTNLQT